jgi:hypothetical protein
METFRSVEGETEYRRSLLTEAATGSARAQQELDREYHVRVYSAQERENYIPPSLPHNLSPAMSRKIDSVVELSAGAEILDRESL